MSESHLSCIILTPGAEVSRIRSPQQRVYRGAGRRRKVQEHTWCLPSSASPVRTNCWERLPSWPTLWLSLRRAAGDDRGVLITAEPGLDAEAVARAIHERGARQASPFVVLACDGTSPSALEKQLHRWAAVGQGGRPRKHLAQSSALYRATGGTLFLADVARAGGAAAAPAGAHPARRRSTRGRAARLPMTLDVRVVAAVEDRLDGGLREELLRRLPLMVDVPPCGNAGRTCRSLPKPCWRHATDRRRFTPAALTVLAALPWRRNTAELAGLIARSRPPPATAQPIRQEDVLAEVQLDRAPARPDRQSARRAPRSSSASSSPRCCAIIHGRCARRRERSASSAPTSIARPGSSAFPLRREGAAEAEGVWMIGREASGGGSRSPCCPARPRRLRRRPAAASDRQGLRSHRRRAFSSVRLASGRRSSCAKSATTRTC